jgi:hypothetical protein
MMLMNANAARGSGAPVPVLGNAFGDVGAVLVEGAAAVMVVGGAVVMGMGAAVVVGATVVVVTAVVEVVGTMAGVTGAARRAVVCPNQPQWMDASTKPTTEALRTSANMARGRVLLVVAWRRAIGGLLVRPFHGWRSP